MNFCLLAAVIRGFRAVSKQQREGNSTMSYVLVRNYISDMPEYSKQFGESEVRVVAGSIIADFYQVLVILLLSLATDYFD